MRKVEIEWIPTEERLPEEGGTYLVSIKNKTCILRWKWCDGCWATICGNPFSCIPPSFVEAWAYLPEPYKED